jgi:RNA polymerase sigma-70 factor (ECF subfamily)
MAVLEHEPPPIRAESFPTPDGELMARMACGDRDAFAELVDRHQRALVAYLGRLCGRDGRAEELAQEAFLRLYQAAARYRDEGRLLPYLFRIAVNLVRSEARRRARWRLLAPLYAQAAAGPGALPGDDLLRGELQRRVRHAVRELPLRFREPLLLFEVEEWSYADIGRALGCREGTVKSRIHRGRERLRRALAAYLQEDPR